VGFGLALVAAPVLVLIEPDFVPGPMVLTGFSMTVLMVVRERETVNLRGVGWVLAGRVPGTVLGAAILISLPGELLARIIGGMILLAVLISACGFTVRPRRPALIAAGLMSGIMGTVARTSRGARAPKPESNPGSRGQTSISSSSLAEVSVLPLSALFFPPGPPAGRVSSLTAV
jgi:hypothetical protein